MDKVRWASLSDSDLFKQWRLSIEEVKKNSQRQISKSSVTEPYWQIASGNPIGRLMNH